MQVINWAALVAEGSASKLVMELLSAGRTNDAADGLMAMVEAMPKSEDRAVESMLCQIAVHIFKMQLMPNSYSVDHWWNEILALRTQVHKKLDNSASMQNTVKTRLPAISSYAAKRVYPKLKIAEPKTRTLPDLSYEDLLERDFIAEIPA